MSAWAFRLPSAERGSSDPLPPCSHNGGSKSASLHRVEFLLSVRGLEIKKQTHISVIPYYYANKPPDFLDTLQGLILKLNLASLGEQGMCG